MYCLSACHVLLYMILYQQTSVVYLQTLTLTIETSPLVDRADVRLKCLYSGPTCCTDDARVWTRDGTEIMNNGAPSDITKYKEERNDASLHFDMKILNLDNDDFGKAFQCQYNFQTSNTVTLIQDNTYESPPTESCPFAYNPAVTKIKITGTLNITKAAPSPVLTAYYGEDNLTRYLSSTGVSNYDTWYYTLTVSTDTQIDCCGHLDDKFKLYAITGTTSTKICDIDMCECWKCFGKCFIVNWSFGILGIILSMLYCIFCGEECEKKKVIKMTVLYGILTVIPSLIVGLIMGLYGCICNEGKLWLFSLVTSIVWCCIAIVIIDKFFYKIDWSDFFKDNKIKLVIGLFGGIAIFMIHDNLKKGGNNRSKESGSSCWPPCSVGPDPNSPDPENARSLLKKNADKKNEKKPVAVVRSQPPKNRHVKTDNTESTRYSAETEIFDEGVHKSAKSRPLPSIGQPTISPRPLPQMPPSSQLEKGGIQLEPLGDSTSEKKKKKRRKKKESKQSGDED